MAQMSTALAEGDAAGIGRAAHTLKGVLGYFGVAEALQTATQLEHMARKGDWTGADATYATLAKVMKEIGGVLAGWK